MRVHVSTFLNASPTTVWSTVKRQEPLHDDIPPMGMHSPLDGKTRGAWISGTAYDGRSFMFSIIPVGTGTIFIKSLDDRSMTTQPREQGEIGTKNGTTCSWSSRMATARATATRLRSTPVSLRFWFGGTQRCSIGKVSASGGSSSRTTSPAREQPKWHRRAGREFVTSCSAGCAKAGREV